jgi:hypothetical protein
MEGIKQFWDTTIGKILIIGIVGSALLVCVLLGFTLFRDNTPASPEDPQRELAATKTQPAATDILVQVTDTAIPTETTLPGTATPTNTPVPTGDAPAVNDPYLDEVNVNLGAFKKAFNNASNYVQTPVTDFSVLSNENWKQDANMALSQLNEAANQLENIDNPPPEYAQLDMQLKSIASETHELVNNFENGVNQLDPNAISNAVNNLTNVSTYVNNATSELDKYYNP